MKNIIFIAGIHGVGKTTLCEKIADYFRIPHYSASQLIARSDNEKVNRDKRVEDVENNQNILLNALKRYTDCDKLMLLDGHFCLINKELQLREVPLETFKTLGIAQIVVLTNDPQVILNRLQDRDKNSMYSLEFITMFQEREISWAKYVGKQCNIEVSVVDLRSNDNCTEHIKELIDSISYKNRGATEK